MGETHRSFIPAAGHDWLLPFYDPLQKLMGGDSARRELVEQADIQPGHRVLDIGCGTGSLVVLTKQLNPRAEITGLDPDPKALARAKRKSTSAAAQVGLDQGFSDELPYPEACFERVLSTFMFHHLGLEEKRSTLREVRRVLVPGGELHLLDFGGSGPGPRGLLARWLHSGEHVRDNLEDRIPTLMAEAGFADPEQTAHRATIFGRIACFRGSRPL
jgi:ubiquinone/menaquinone biosynthesis C-methylase UbiE